MMKALNRIYIVGHPAAGKAYFSKHLADKLGYQFVDADMGLEHRIGLPLQDIIGREGLIHYERTQERIFHSLALRSGIVVGLDCHVAHNPSIREYLKNACVVFLKTTLETQLRRCGSWHEPLVLDRSYEQVLAMLQKQRNDFYHDISDLVLAADDGEVEKHSEIVLEYIKENDYTLVSSNALSDRDLVFFKNNTDITVRLTEQQALSLKLLAKGLSAKEIANELAISHRTVEVYIAQIKEKLDCDSSKDLISLYLTKH